MTVSLYVCIFIPSEPQRIIIEDDDDDQHDGQCEEYDHDQSSEGDDNKQNNIECYNTQ